MENIFKYIKVSDINPSLKIYHSDPETDAEETRLLSSDDELLSTEDERDEYNEQYENLRRRFVLSEIKCNKFQNENTRLHSKLIEKEQIIISIRNEMDDLEIEKEKLLKDIIDLKNETDINKKEKENYNNKKIVFAGFIGFVGGIIVCYISK